MSSIKKSFLLSKYKELFDLYKGKSIKELNEKNAEVQEIISSFTSRRNLYAELIMNILNNSGEYLSMFCNTNIRHEKNKFSKYKFVKELGHGYVGVAYLVKDGSKQVVIKRVLLDSTSCSNIVNEIENLKKLSDSNITPKFIDVYFHGRAIYIVMDYIEGTTLYELVEKNEVTSDLANKIIDKLDRMHNLGLIHGDLHDNNIMIDKNGEPFIIDLGLSYSIETKIDTDNTIVKGLQELLGEKEISMDEAVTNTTFKSYILHNTILNELILMILDTINDI